MRCCEEYFNNRYQVVFAIHYEVEKQFHIHSDSLVSSKHQDTISSVGAELKIFCQD